jgi:IS5 family transposase
MISIPDFLPAVILPFWSRLLTALSAQIFALALPRSHYLVQLTQHLDCTPLEQACATYQHTAGPGNHATHTVPRLVRALLVKYLRNLSLRELEDDIRTNLASKWFVGYSPFEAGPDHSTLARFEQWVIAHQARTFFDEVLRQIDQDCPEERRQPQIGDTYALRANAARETLIVLVRHTCRRLLEVLAEADAASHTTLLADLEQTALFGASDEVKEYRLTTEQRRRRLATTAVAAAKLADRVRTYLANSPLAPAQRQPAAAWLAHLDKILTDEFTLSRDAQQHVTAAAERPQDAKGSYRLGSATDPDATYRVHDAKTDFGYNVNVAATQHFIREVQVDTGAQPDPVAIPEVLRSQQEQHDLTPTKFIYDAAAGAGKHFATVAASTDGQTQLVAPPIPYDTRTERFTPDDFALSPDATTLTCPHGRTSTTAYDSQSGQGRNFRFTAQQCATCPLADKCRGAAVRPDHMRQVFISDFRSILAQARTYAQTEDFKADMKLRATIERIIANLVRYHAARDAQRRGQRNCQYQAHMNAMAFNLRQWLRQLARRSAPVPTAAST